MQIGRICVAHVYAHFEVALFKIAEEIEFVLSRLSTTRKRENEFLNLLVSGDIVVYGFFARFEQSEDAFFSLTGAEKAIAVVLKKTDWIGENDRGAASSSTRKER